MSNDHRSCTNPVQRISQYEPDVMKIIDDDHRICLTVQTKLRKNDYILHLFIALLYICAVIGFIRTGQGKVNNNYTSAR